MGDEHKAATKQLVDEVFVISRIIERTWHDYPEKSCTAVIHDMITRDLDMIIE